MWDYSSRGNYHALQTGGEPPVRSRHDVLDVLRPQPGADARAQQRLRAGRRAGVPVRTAELHSGAGRANSTGRTRRITGRTTSSSTSSTRCRQSRAARSALLANDWQISGIYRYSSGVPYPINYSIPGITATNLTGNNGAPSARIVVNGDPGPGSSDDPYRQIANVECLRAAAAGQRRQRVGAVLPARSRRSTTSTSRSPSGFRLKGTAAFEIRFDLFNALDHMQWTGVNNTINFASLTDPTITNLPYDSSGQSGQSERVRFDHRRASAAHAPARHALHVLVGGGPLQRSAPNRCRPPFSVERSPLLLPVAQQLERDGVRRVSLQQAFEDGDALARAVRAQVNLGERHVGALELRRLLDEALQAG